MVSSRPTPVVQIIFGKRPVLTNGAVWASQTGRSAMCLNRGHSRRTASIQEAPGCRGEDRRTGERLGGSG